MYKKLLIVIGLLLLASSVSASDDWWNTSYQYRIPITLTGNTSGAQTNYQLMLNVSYDSDMQSDFDDLRFTDDSGNLQSAWLENKTNDSWADIWINFTSTPDDGATQTYYMYYGNLEVSNYWNGDNTFIFTDDFEENNLNKWQQTSYGSISSTSHSGIYAIQTSTGACCHDDPTLGCISNNFSAIHNCIIDYWFRMSGNQAYLGLYEDSNNFFKNIVDSQPHEAMYTDFSVTESGSSLGTTSDAGDFSASTWYHSKIIIDDTTITWFFDTTDASTQRGVMTNANIINLDFINLDFISRYDYMWVDDIKIHKYTSTPPSYTFSIEEEYIPPTPAPTPIPPPAPTPLPEITAGNYVIQNQTLYITQPCDLQYKITSNSFVYGGLRNINTVICDNNNTVISGWFKISTDQAYDADYTFFINVNDTSYESKIVTLKQEQVDSSIISKTYRRTLIIDGYEIYSYNTTIYIVSILPNPIYFYFNLEDRIIQFGDKQFNNQTLVFNQLNFDDQYKFMNNASSDTIVMKFKAINPEQKSGAELKGLTGILLNALSKIPFIGKSFKNVLYYPLFFIQTIFDFVFTFLDIIVNDWWYGLMLMEIVCIFVASRNKGYVNVMEVYIDTHVKIIKFIYEWIILKTINLIITIVVTIKDMIKWW